MIIRVRIPRQFRLRLTYLHAYLLMRGLHKRQVLLHRLLHLGKIPYPSAVAALEVDTAMGDVKRIDEFEWEMFVEDEDVAEVAIAGDMVDLPEFTVAARDKGAGFN